MTSTLIKAPALAALGAAAALTLAACGSSGSSVPASSAPASSHAAPAAGTTETATETEFHIALSATSLKPGTYTFRVSNKGQTTHALTVDGPGVSDKSTGDISPGSSATLTVTMKAGSYDVFCPVGDHKSMGMDETVRVS